MSTLIPINPYTRKPIKLRKRLAGRSAELAELEYFFKLTADGQSPHVALIGARGVGKSSLLQTSAEMARELNILPISIEMNDKKASSQGSFWQQLYSALCFSAASSGCWGGLSGNIYQGLYDLIECQIATDTDVPLLFPRSLPKFRGDLDSLICSDALIDRDLETLRNELKLYGHKGAVILIDEADCLRHDPPMLQMLRNVFQKADGFSLALAGTEELFSSISEVFSPIPRQFHKLEIKPFRHWSDTRQLVCEPIPEEFQYLLPSTVELMDLHRMCGGDPQELQLTCFHMYKSIELGRTQTMKLDPEIFRSVLQEYRSTTPEDAQLLVKKIEDLPREVFLNYPWLHYTNLTTSESVELMVFRAELDEADPLSPQEIQRITKQVEQSYNLMFESGISTEREMLKMEGGSFIRGFWKSFVEVDLGERWIWQEDPFESLVLKDVLSYLEQNVAATCSLVYGVDYSEQILRHLSNSSIDKIEAPNEAGSFEGNLDLAGRLHQAVDLLATFKVAQTNERTKMMRIPLLFQYRKLSVSYIMTIVDYSDLIEKESELIAILEDRKALFGRYGIDVQFGVPEEWPIPNAEQFEELQKKLGIRIGPSLAKEAARAGQLFGEGKVAEAANIFEMLLEKSPSPFVLNNLGFCKINLGEIVKAKALFEQAIEKRRDSLFVHNLGMANLCNGDRNRAIELMLEALRINETEKDQCEYALFMLMAHPDGQHFYIDKDIPVCVGIMRSLHNLENISEEMITSKIKIIFSKEPKAASKWLSYILDKTKLQSNPILS